MALNEFSNQTHTSPKILNGDTFCSSQESSGPNRLENDKLEPIAVVGMSLKFPQSATSPDSFWQMLLDGRSAMTEIPKDRLNIDAFYHADANRSGSLPVRGGHFIEENLALFDAPFFSISPAEAACLDPQQRLLLETSYTALENAGIPMEKCLGSRTSVYTGSFTDDYRGLLNRDHELQATYAAIGLAASILANRISWFFDFKGPSVNLDSACSSSLTALDIACKGLRNGEASMSLVGGSNLIFNPDFMLAMSNLNFLSHDSRSYSFDHRANGYARGEGIGVVVIKRLSDAVRDGDTVRAVIRSTGSNQDGRTPGITVPNGTAQEDLIQETYRTGGLDMAATRFSEAHGTGTAVGDPLEANALGRCFRQYRTTKDPLYVGAVKSNVGHLEGASGVAGLIKTVLVLENGVIPPNINFEMVNPRIDPEALRIHFPTRITPWPSQGLRRASVNSFGFGGSNAHAILDDAYNYLASRKIKANHITVPLPPVGETIVQEHAQESLAADTCNGASAPAQSKLLVWSAADEAGLKRVAKTFECYIKQSKRISNTTILEDMAYTLAVRRSNLEWKSFLVTNDVSELTDLQENLSKPLKAAQTRNLAFIFTGQGAQYPRMGQQLLAFEVFRNSLQEASSFFLKLGSTWSLMDALLGESTIINDPEYSQPLCTALQIALLDLLRHCNITPVAVVGHSSGEIAAAYCCGALSRDSAWRVAFCRGKVAASLARREDGRGAMTAVGLSEEAIKPYLSQLSQKFGTASVVVGCINSPANVTLSGHSTQIEQLESWLSDNNVIFRRLHVNVAYHSPFMNAVTDAYLADLNDLKAGEPTNITMISSVTGARIRPQKLGRGEYWAKNMVSPVQFSKALTQICLPTASKKRKRLGQPVQCAITANDLLEIGPHSSLRSPIRDTLANLGRAQHVGYHTCLKRNSSAARAFQEALGYLHCSGYQVNLLKANNMGAESRPVLADLPAYPFNHSQSHWVESRFSKDVRFRRHAKSDLLGLPCSDWNPLEPRWRYVLRLNEIPWVEDHKINGVCIYPAAGMIAMAVEAVKQLAADKKPYRPISGYRIENAEFSKALRLPRRESQIETSFSLRPVTDALEKERAWYEYRLCVYEDESWEECCHGCIQAEYELPQNEVDDGKASSREALHYQHLVKDGFIACDLPMTTEELYQLFNDHGAQYGPAFQVLSNVCYNGRECQSVAEISLGSRKLEKSKLLKRPYVFHPATLDGVFQTIVPALGRGGQRKLPTMVVSYIQSLYISAQGLAEPEGPPLHAFSHCEFKGYRETESSICAILPQSGQPCIILQGLRSTFVTNDDSAQDASNERHLCASMDWKPDLDVSSGGEIQKFCEQSRPGKESPARHYEDLRLMIFYYIVDAVGKLRNDAGPQEYHRVKYLEWMKEQIRRHDHGEVGRRHSELSRTLAEAPHCDALMKRVQRASNEGTFFAAVGENLLDIMQGKVDALDLLFRGDLAQNYYQELNSDPSIFEPFASYLDCLTHKHAFIKVLEIGAGTSGATSPVLEALSAQAAKRGSMRSFHYDLTDISPEFLSNAKERFGSYGESINYKILNIETDPSPQGFQEEEYDLIIASNVLHAVRDIHSTLSNIRKLLKPEAKLVLFEVTEPHMMRAGFAFGLLKGWWLATNDERWWSPCLTEPAWNNALRQTGFGGIDVLFPDYHETQLHERSIMIATASSDSHEESRLSEMSAAIITVNEITSQQELGRQLQKQLKSTHDMHCELLSLEQAAANTGSDIAIHICLLEVDNLFLSGLQEGEFESLKRIISSSKCIVWISRDGGIYSKRPEFGMVFGFARAIRSEYSQLKFVTIALEESVYPVKSAETILKILRRTLMLRTAQIEPEYRQRNGMHEISRIIGNSHLNHTLTAKTASEERTTRPFGQRFPLELHVASPGFLESLEFHEDPVADKPLGENEIEVEVKVTGVNFRDCLIALGRLQEKRLGTECAGVVKQIGSKVTNVVQGDRVSVASTNTYKTLVRANALCAVRIPDDMSLIDAASLPTTAITAYYALLKVARLQKDETILIHSGAGATGQMAIQIAQYVQAKIYTTVGSMDKQQFLMDRYDIPRQCIFYSRDTSFAQGIRQETGGIGVDVILNSLSGEGLKASWECVAPFGRFIEIGKADIQSHKSLQMTQFARNVSFSAVDLLGIVQERPLLVQELFQGMMALVRDGKLHPAQPMKVYPVSEITQAFRYLQSGKNTGKAVVEYHQDDLVTTLLKNRPTYDFHHDATYVIAGGLGGLGRSIARWMVSRGARHLILLSRSGPKSSAAKDLLSDLRKGGAQVEAPACDITRADALCRILEECARTMPPIRGCIQGTMVLRDTVFENMSYEDFTASTKPKVAGSWNLHAFLPKGMDFFILLSSICGIFGAASQVNYCTGNTYKDALAQFRIAHGEKAVSLDLGMMINEGVVAENESLMGFLRRTGYFMEISQPELFALLDHYCDPALPILTPLDCQIIIGIEIPEVLNAAGLDQPEWMRRPMFRHFHQMVSGNAVSSLTGPDSAPDYAVLLRTADSGASAAAVVSEAITNKIAKVMGIQPEDIDLSKPMHSYGVDSLVAVEVRNWLLRDLGADVAIFDILGSASLAEMSGTIASGSSHRN